MLFSFLLMDASATKFHHYVLPVLPGVAILVALFLDQLWDEGPVAYAIPLLLGRCCSSSWEGPREHPQGLHRSLRLQLRAAVPPRAGHPPGGLRLVAPAARGAGTWSRPCCSRRGMDDGGGRRCGSSRPLADPDARAPGGGGGAHRARDHQPPGDVQSADPPRVPGARGRGARALGRPERPVPAPPRSARERRGGGSRGGAPARGPGSSPRERPLWPATSGRR